MKLGKNRIGCKCNKLIIMLNRKNETNARFLSSAEAAKTRGREHSLT